MVDSSVTRATTVHGHGFGRGAPVTPAAGDGVGEGVAGQRQTDNHGHGAGDGGGQNGFHHFACRRSFTSRPAAMETRPEKHDAELGVLDGARGENTRGLTRSAKPSAAHHAGDGREIGEAGAVVQGDLPAR